MGKYLKQGFVRKLEWQLAREEISHSKMVELMEEECIENYTKEVDIIQKEEEWTRMFDSDHRVAMALLTYIRDNK